MSAAVAAAAAEGEIVTVWLRGRWRGSARRVAAGVIVAAVVSSSSIAGAQVL